MCEPFSEVCMVAENLLFILVRIIWLMISVINICLAKFCSVLYIRCCTLLKISWCCRRKHWCALGLGSIIQIMQTLERWLTPWVKRSSGLKQMKAATCWRWVPRFLTVECLTNAYDFLLKWFPTLCLGFHQVRGSAVCMPSASECADGCAEGRCCVHFDEEGISLLVI